MGEDAALTGNLWMWVCIGIAIVFVLVVFLYFVNKKLRNKYKLKVGKVAVNEDCEKIIRGTVDPVNADRLVKKSEQLINMKKEDSETTSDFIKRIAKYVEYSIPSDTDFCRIDSDNKERCQSFQPTA